MNFSSNTKFDPRKFIKAPVTTLAPSICKRSNKLLSDTEHPSQTTSAYSKDERTKVFNKTSRVKGLKLYFSGLRRFNILETFWQIFEICAGQDKIEDKVEPRCSWTVTSSTMLLRILLRYRTAVRYMQVNMGDNVPNYEGDNTAGCRRVWKEKTVTISFCNLHCTNKVKMFIGINLCLVLIEQNSFGPCDSTRRTSISKVPFFPIGIRLFLFGCLFACVI